MTLAGFIMKSSFRNKRRSILTILSIGFSLLLLTLMMTIWRSFYLDKGAPESAKRVITRHKTSLANFLPLYYRDKIRTIPGVVAVVPMTWFGGKYIDDRPEHSFTQMATDPDEYLKVASDKIVPPDQVAAWQRDRAGAMVDADLAKKYGWKIGDRITLLGTIFEVNPELTIRAIYTMDPPPRVLYFNAKYLEEAVPWFKGTAGFYDTRVETEKDVPEVEKEIDDMFHNAPAPTRIRRAACVSGFLHGATGQRSKPSFLASAARLDLRFCWCRRIRWQCRVRSRTSEVAVLKTLGFTKQRVLSLFVGESIALAVIGGLSRHRLYCAFDAVSKQVSCGGGRACRLPRSLRPQCWLPCW